MGRPDRYDAYRRVLKGALSELNTIDLTLLMEGADEDKGFANEVIAIGMSLMESRGRSFVPHAKSKPRRKVAQETSQRLVNMLKGKQP